MWGGHDLSIFVDIRVKGRGGLERVTILLKRYTLRRDTRYQFRGIFTKERESGREGGKEGSARKRDKTRWCENEGIHFSARLFFTGPGEDCICSVYSFVSSIQNRRVFLQEGLYSRNCSTMMLVPRSTKSSFDGFAKGTCDTCTIVHDAG